MHIVNRAGLLSGFLKKSRNKKIACRRVAGGHVSINAGEGVVGVTLRILPFSINLHPNP